MPAARIGPAPWNENALRLSELRLSPPRLDELRLDERLWVRVAIDFSLVWIACPNGQGRGRVPVVRRASRTVRRVGYSEFAGGCGCSGGGVDSVWFAGVVGAGAGAFEGAALSLTVFSTGGSAF